MITRIFALALLLTAHIQRSNGEIRKFPEKFRFGVATSAYQIEGAWNVSDKGESIWDRFTHTTDNIIDNSNGDIACDSYHKYERDVEMVSELGMHFYRFSLSWSRILPTGLANTISKDGIKYYNDLLDELVRHNIEPIVTIHHFDLPQSLQDIGGWTNSMAVNAFADYARVVFETFGDRVKTWITINEPMIQCQLGYGTTFLAPGMNRSGVADYLCGHNMIKAHAKAYHIYNDVYKPKQKGRISITLNANWIDPEKPQDIQLAEDALQFELGWFAHPIFSKDGDYPEVMKKVIATKSKKQGFRRSRLPEFTREEVEFIRGTYDFFGLNHYTTILARANILDSAAKAPSEVSYEDDLGYTKYQDPNWKNSPLFWLKVVPWGMTKILNWIKENYGNQEIMILECGYADDGDIEDISRIEYFEVYFNAVLDAIDNGCDVTAFSVWTLMDNFEWFMGYEKTFGLYHVDRNDNELTKYPKASAKFFTEIVKSMSIKKTDSNLMCDERNPMKQFYCKNRSNDSDNSIKMEL